MAKERKGGLPPVGGSSLLVIFAVLCLTVFALLALSTVEAGGRLSEKAISSVEEYYAADTRAEEIVAELRSGKSVDGVTVQDGVYSYTVPIREGQSLTVRLRLAGNQETILQWKTVSESDWTPNEDLPVWDGSFE